MKVTLGVGILMTLVMGAIATGCGGGSGSTTTGTPKLSTPLTKSAFISKANALCVRAEQIRGRTILAAEKRLSPGAKVTEAEQEVLIETALVPYKKMIPQFEELGAPKGESRQIQAIVRALKSAVSSVQANPGLAITSDSQFAEFNRLALKYGLDACQV
jgi:hypothetical protein